MKDMVIKGKAVYAELLILAVCLLIAYSLNVYAVIHYSRPLTELLSSLGYVVVVAAAIYAVLWLPRLLILILKRLIRHINNNKPHNQTSYEK